MEPWAATLSDIEEPYQGKKKKLTKNHFFDAPVSLAYPEAANQCRSLRSGGLKADFGHKSCGV